jgi:tRNA uridine 5-carboxymethylaminomethyl modification enzyme
MLLKKKEWKAKEIKRLNKIHLQPGDDVNKKLESLGTAPLDKESSILNLLRRPEISYSNLQLFTDIETDVPGHFTEYLDAEVQYEGYIKKHLLEIEQFKKLENKQIPEDFDYKKYKGFAKEAQQKLSELRPKTVGQASRIQGVTPSDINVLLVLLKKFSR